MYSKFLFARQKRSASVCRRLKLEKNEIAIFEGIHALNNAITDPNPEATKIYISAIVDFLDDEGKKRFTGTCLRLMRRVVRDNNFRGASAEYTIALWDNVLRGEKLYIYPFMDKADITINSALLYGLAVMKQFACPLFAELPETILRETLARFCPLLSCLRIFPPTLYRIFSGNS